MRPQRQHYRRRLADAADCEELLRSEARLPPRANLELALAFADVGDPAVIRRLAALTPAEAPTGSPTEFLAFCGVLGLGRLAADGDTWQLAVLRRHAVDPRWRIREAAVMALQRFGETDPEALVAVARLWATGGPRERQAAAAAVTAPCLLADPGFARDVFGLLGSLTERLATNDDARPLGELIPTLGCAWSRAIVATPELGKPALSCWLDSPHGDVRRVLRRALQNGRLLRLDAAWVAASRARIGEASAAATRRGEDQPAHGGARSRRAIAAKG